MTATVEAPHVPARWTAGRMSIFLLVVSIGLSTAAVIASDGIPASATTQYQASGLLALLCVVLAIIVMHVAALIYAGIAMIKGDGRGWALLGLFPLVLFLPPLFAFQQLMEKLDALPAIAA